MKSAEPQLNVWDETESEGCTICAGEKPGGDGVASGRR